MLVCYISGCVVLCDYGGEGCFVVVILLLINLFDIFDLLLDILLMWWIVGQGYYVWLFDWGLFGFGDCDFDFVGYVEYFFLLLLCVLFELLVLVGYCFGGMLGIVVVVMMFVVGFVMIVVLWYFVGYGEFV